jgi:hypothetical protein
MLVGLITRFTLMVKLAQRSSQTAGVAQLIELLTSNQKVVGLSPTARSKINLTEVRFARMKGTLTSWD